MPHNGTYYSIYNSMHIMLLKVLLKTVEEGALNTLNDFHLLCDKMLSPLYKFCPGVSESEYEDFRKDIRYDPSHVHITKYSAELNLLDANGGLRSLRMHPSMKSQLIV